MPDTLTVLCPGQGAQYVGMARAWYDASPEARAVLQRADEILGDRLGAPLTSLCFDGPAESLNRTDVSQPAIYAASVASFAGQCAAWGCSAAEAPIAAAAGLSLGEYTALHLAGAFSFEDGLELVTLRGRAMQDAAEAVPSAMLALIGADEPSAHDLCARALVGMPEGEVLVPANFNAPGQVVVSGTTEACDRAAKLATLDGLRVAPLPVAGAFHSPVMAPAAERLGEALASAPIREPRCPVVSNVTGRPHCAEKGEDVPASIRHRLAEQLTSPVRWAASCAWLLEDPSRAASIHELAPGKTLAGLMRRIDRTTKVETHDEP